MPTFETRRLQAVSTLQDLHHDMTLSYAATTSKWAASVEGHDFAQNLDNIWTAIELLKAAPAVADSL